MMRHAASTSDGARCILIEVIDADHAEAILADRADRGLPLSDAEARAIARHCDLSPDPNTAAGTLLSTGYRGCRGLRRLPWRPASPAFADARALAGEGERAGAPVEASNPGRVRVLAELQPQLWAACCRETGHAPNLVDKAGGWTFDVELVRRLEVAS